MNDDIIRMAREAQQEQLSLDGRSVPSTALSGYWFSMEVADLARFAALVRAAEQDRCCRIIFGMAGSDNVAQRTVEKIRNTQHNDDNPSF